MNEIVMGIVENQQGTHSVGEALKINFDVRLFIIFAICYLVSVLISKKISKREKEVTNIVYCILFGLFCLCSIINSIYMSNLPPHNIYYIDLCGIVGLEIILFLTWHIPVIFVNIKIIKYIVMKVNNKKEEKKL